MIVYFRKYSNLLKTESESVCKELFSTYQLQKERNEHAVEVAFLKTVVFAMMSMKAYNSEGLSSENSVLKKINDYFETNPPKEVLKAAAKTAKNYFETNPPKEVLEAAAKTAKNYFETNPPKEFLETAAKTLAKLFV